MKNIKFHKQGTGLDLILVALMLPFLAIYLYGGITDTQSTLYSVSMIVTHLLIVFMLGRWIVQTDIVFYNRTGMSIKLDRKLNSKILGVNVKYVDIKEVVFQEKTMIIKRLTSNDLEFDLSNYKTEDVEKLQSFIADQTNLYGLRKYKTSIA